MSCSQKVPSSLPFGAKGWGGRSSKSSSSSTAAGGEEEEVILASAMAGAADFFCVCFTPARSSCSSETISLIIFRLRNELLTRSRVFTNATSSVRRRGGFSPFRFSSYSNSTFSAVPYPTVCSLPQSRHLSHPTQSISLLTLRKRLRKSSFSSAVYPASGSWNMVPSSKKGGCFAAVLARWRILALVVASWAGSPEQKV